MNSRLMVFIPMYNCEKQISRVLNQFSPDIQKLFSEIIIIDNGSTDNSLKQATIGLKKLTHINASLLQNDQNINLGGSHKVAFNYAQKHNFDAVIVLHGDDQGSIKDIVPYIKDNSWKKTGCFLGARFMPKSTLTGYAPLRTFGNLAFNALFSLATGKKLYDLGSGLNLFHTKALCQIPYMKFGNNLLFNYYLILALCTYKVSFTFFPLEWREDDQVSNAKLWQHGLNTLKLLGKFRMNPKKFLQTDHVKHITNAYTFKIIYDKKSKNYDPS